MGKTFKFDMGAKVEIIASGETGTVEGRAEYSNSANTYYVLYKSADGRATQAWWTEDTLQAG